MLSPLREQSSLSNSPFLYAAGLLLLLRPGPSLLTPGLLFFSSTTSSYTSILPRHPPTSPPLKQTKKKSAITLDSCFTHLPKGRPPLSLCPPSCLPKVWGVFSIFFPVTPPSPQIVSCYRNVAVPCWKITRPIDSVRCDKVFLSLARGTVHKETFLRGSFFFLFSFYNLLAAGLSNTIRL